MCCDDVVDLAHALTVMRTPSLIKIRSDNALSTGVNASAHAGPHNLLPIPAVHGDQAVRVVDVLRDLAQATAPLYGTDLYDAYTSWAQYRYLGAFDLRLRRKTHRLRPSAAVRNIVGNQRRVTSEEMGIGFGSWLAKQHILRGRKGWIPQITDIDLALSGRDLASVRKRWHLDHVGGRRPDYIVHATEPSSPYRQRLLLLECKGTKNGRYSIDQLAKAGTQLRTLLVNGHQPEGLAVSAVMTDASVWLSALGTERGSTAPDGAVRLREIALDLDRVKAGREVRVDTAEVPDLEDLAAAALRASWASLADYAGNEDGFRVWAPEALRVKTRTVARSDRPLTERESGQANYIGYSTVVDLPGGRLEVFRGLDQDVFTALSSGEAEAVLVAQGSAAMRTVEVGAPDSPQRTLSVGLDGAVLMLTTLSQV